MANLKTEKTCPKGHLFYKSSDCLSCPKCEAEKQKNHQHCFSTLVAPARRALETKGIETPQQLANYTETEILALHGMGKSSLPKLKKILLENQLEFKQEK